MLLTDDDVKEAIRRLQEAGQTCLAELGAFVFVRHVSFMPCMDSRRYTAGSVRTGEILERDWGD